MIEILDNPEPFSNRDGKCKRKLSGEHHFPPLTTFPWFDRAAGFPSPRPQDADAGAYRSCQGWPLFVATEGLVAVGVPDQVELDCFSFGNFI